jgi:hypothetical protein
MIKKICALFKNKTKKVELTPVFEYKIEVKKLQKGMTVKVLDKDHVQIVYEGTRLQAFNDYQTKMNGIKGTVVETMDSKQSDRRSVMVKIETTAGQRYNAWFYSGQKATVIK